jgi:hypothetical protein
MRNWKIHSFLKLTLLAALVWLVYWGSLHGPFAFDDWHVIPQNPSVRGPSDIPSFFKDPGASSCTIEYATFPEEDYGYRWELQCS